MNHINNIEVLEKEMIELLSLSLTQPFAKDAFDLHPIRLTEALKSIIGLNLENPNKKIINFINKIKLHPQPPNRESPAQYESRTVSIYQLKEAIIDSDLDRVNEISDNFLQLSDGKHILEYFIELSLAQTGNSLLVVWPIYKAMNFIGYSNRESMRNAITGACQSLILDEFRASRKDEGTSIDSLSLDSIEVLDQLYTLGVLHEINNSNFIRKHLIKENTTFFVSFFYNEVNKAGNEIENLTINASKQINILKILDDIDISEEAVLCLNALRSISKYSNLRNRDVRRFLELTSGLNFGY